MIILHGAGWKAYPFSSIFGHAFDWGAGYHVSWLWSWRPSWCWLPSIRPCGSRLLQLSISLNYLQVFNLSYDVVSDDCIWMKDFVIDIYTIFSIFSRLLTRVEDIDLKDPSDALQRLKCRSYSDIFYIPWHLEIWAISSHFNYSVWYPFLNKTLVLDMWDFQSRPAVKGILPQSSFRPILDPEMNRIQSLTIDTVGIRVNSEHILLTLW